MFIQGSFNCWSIFDKAWLDNFIFLWQVEAFIEEAPLDASAANLSSADIDEPGFDQAVGDSLDCASDTVHRPLAMVDLVIIPL